MTDPRNEKDKLPADEHWGQALNRLLDELEPVEFVSPEIEDPVEWVKHQRAEEQKRRLGDWGVNDDSCNSG